MTAATDGLREGPTPMTTAGGDGIPLRYGFTVDDVDSAARRAAFLSAWKSVSVADRFDIARYAIVEHLLSSDGPPDNWWALVVVGEYGIEHHAVDELRHRGLRRHTERGSVTMPRFWAYWRPAGRCPLEDRIVEAMAVRQIIPRLRPAEFQAVQALAAYGTHELAAQALDKSLVAFHSAMRDARRMFLRLWHEGEPPSRIWSRDKRTADGGTRDVADFVRQRRAMRKWRSDQPSYD